MKKRKTLSLPTVLIDTLQQQADSEDRSFNYVATRILKSVFLSEGVGQLKKKASKNLPEAVRHLEAGRASK